MVVPSREREIAMSPAADQAYLVAATLKQTAEPQANGQSTNHADLSKPQAIMAKIAVAVMVTVLLVGAMIAPAGVNSYPAKSYTVGGSIQSLQPVW